MLTVFILAAAVLQIGAQVSPTGDLPISSPVRDFCRDHQGACPDRPLTIGGWNMQRLGASKANKPEVMDVIAKTIKKYDLIVLQEVTDTSLKATKKLLDLLNENVEEEDMYDLVISPKIGPAKYKEQYAYYFKNSTFKFEKGEKYEDAKDTFQIEPFVAKFKVLNDGKLRRFFVIPLHSKPKDAVNEIDALTDVYDEMTKIMKTREAIILGDFNAGCSYVTGNKYNDMRLFTQSRFDWLISDHADTTTKATTCPYDRIVIAGNNMKASVYRETAGPFYFDEEFGIENQKGLTAKVSDHYPVGVVVRSALRRKVSTDIQQTVSTKFSSDASFDDVMSQLNQLEGSQGSCETSVSEAGTIWVHWECPSQSDAVNTLVESAKVLPGIFNQEAVGSLVYKVTVGGLKDATLYERAPQVKDVEVDFYCWPAKNAADTLRCGLSMAVPTMLN